MRLRRGLGNRREPLPSGIQTKLAHATLRAAHKAADNGKCAVAEMLFAFGGADLRTATVRARSIGTVVKTLGAGMAGADAAKAIIACHERAKVAHSSSEKAP